MKFLTERSKTELLLISVGLPLAGSILSTIIGFNHIDWVSLFYLIGSMWWISAIFELNKAKKEFDQVLPSITGTVVLLTLFIDTFIVDINDRQPEGALLIAINIIFPLSAFYLIYILTRLYGSTVYNRDPRGLDVFPEFIYFAVFPLGMWKYQENIKKYK